MTDGLVEAVCHEVWLQDTDATDLADCRTETMRVFAAIKAQGLIVVPVGELRSHLTTLRTHQSIGTFEKYPNLERAVAAMIAAAGDA